MPLLILIVPIRPALMFDIYNAAINSNPLSETKPSCPTGNCTWPPFTSLGFCSKCEDISRLFQNRITYGVEYYFCGHSWTTHKKKNSDCYPSIRNYTYTFPDFNGQVFNIDDFDKLPSHPSSFNVTFSPEYYQGNPFLTFSLKPKLRFNFTDGTSTPSGGLVLFIRLNGKDQGLGDILHAEICALSYCAQKRHAAVTLDQFSSPILQTVYGKPIADESVLRRYPYDTKVLSFTGDDFNITFPPVPKQPYYDINTYNSDVPDGDAKDTSLEQWEDNLGFLMSQFQDKITPAFPFPNNYEDEDEDEDGEGYHTEDDLLPRSGFKIIDAFKASSNIPMMMDNIATALTNYVRDSSNLTVVGQVGEAHIFVTVIWPWIILPAVLVIASIIFLMLAIYESKRKGAQVWRTSELALLFYGRKVWQDELHAFHRVSDMEHAASEIQVQMVKTSDGEWILQRDKED